jgi:hypothetical protein
LASPGTIHRDGWLFQFVSWIVCFQQNPDLVVRNPQPRPADKGFDGLAIYLENSSVQHLLISEDKATNNPRKKILEEVFPEFDRHENGERDNELRAEIATLLEQRSDIDLDGMMESADWLTNKRYRASVATSRRKVGPRTDIFADYEDHVIGDQERRYANLYIHDDLRSFFHDLSKRIVTHLEALRPS